MVMPNEVSEAAIAAVPGARERIGTMLLSLTREEHARVFAAALFVLGLGVMLMYRPFSQLEVGDSAGYDYIAQSIQRGQLPYRDVVDMKTPASMYLSAFAMAAGQLIGLRDVIAVRLFQSVLVGLLCVVTFQVARAYLRSVPAALIAAVLPLTSYKFAEWMVVGTQPKLPMILFGMLSVLFIAKGRPFWAGLTSMLSFLCWQPGLMFTGVAVLMFSRYLTRWRDWRAAKVVLGAALPLIVVVAYFYSRRALGDMWAWTMAFNFSVFAPETQREPLRALNHIWSVTKRVFGADAFAALFGMAGFVLLVVQRLRSKLNRSDGREVFTDAVLIPPVIYFAFCIVNMQSGPDLIPFIPFFGMFAGWFVVQLGEFIQSWTQRSVRVDPVRWDLLAPAAVLGLVLFVALGRAASYRIAPGYSLQDQDNLFEPIRALLGPDDKLYVHGYAEVLVLLNRPNLNPYTFLNQGIDRFASARRGGDFNLIIDEMESQHPKIVALGRLKTVASRELLERWVAERYEKLESFTSADVYIRKGA